MHDVARHYGVATDRYKLVHFYEPEFNYWELFDLKKDPREMRSVYGQPKYAETQKELEQELTRLRTELNVPPRIPPRRSSAARPLARPLPHDGGALSARLARFKRCARRGYALVNTS